MDRYINCCFKTTAMIWLFRQTTRNLKTKLTATCDEMMIYSNRGTEETNEGEGLNLAAALAFSVRKYSRNDFEDRSLLRCLIPLGFTVTPILLTEVPAPSMLSALRSWCDTFQQVPLALVLVSRVCFPRSCLGVCLSKTLEKRLLPLKEHNVVVIPQIVNVL